MQMLREQRQTAERELRGLAHANSILRDVAFWLPVEQIVQHLDTERKKFTNTEPNKTDFGAVVKALDTWRAFVPRQDRTRRALLVLEAWNLGVIGVSLIGFNYVPILARASWFSCALLVVATGTVLVPLWCVWVWTKRVET
jgi:hypothetical protein